MLKKRTDIFYIYNLMYTHMDMKQWRDPANYDNVLNAIRIREQRHTHIL